MAFFGFIDPCFGTYSLWRTDLLIDKAVASGKWSLVYDAMFLDMVHN